MSSTTNGSATSGETKKGRVSAKKSQDGPWTKLKAVIYPDWAQEGMKSSRSWKTFARCMIALFCTMVLLVDNSSLQFMGQAGFFGLIVSVMLPPSMALSVFLFAMLTLILGVCFGWAWGCAAMAAGLQARDQVLLQQQVQTATSGFDQNANLDAQYRAAIFQGRFLDPRSSTVFGVFLFIGAYLFGLLRAHKPRLTLMSIFGTIILDVMCSYGPLFPVGQYTLARILLVPAALYIAIATACTLLIFPQSLSHIIIGDVIKTNLKPIQSILKMQDDVLSTAPSDSENIAKLAEKSKKLRFAQVQGINAVEDRISMLQLEITRCQIGPASLGKIFDKTRELSSKTHGLGSFVMLMEENNRTLAKGPAQDTQSSQRIKKHYEHMQKHRHRGTTLDDLIPVVASSTAELRAAADKSFEDAIAWLDAVNHSRWTKPAASVGDITVREANLARLQETLAEFRATGQFDVLEPYRELFDKEGNIRSESKHAIRASAPTVFRCNVFTSTLISFTITLVEFLELLLKVERENPKSRIQLPTAFAKMLMKSANSSSSGGNPLDLGTGNAEDDSSASDSTETLVEEKKEKAKKAKNAKIYAKDPDAGDPSNGFQKLGRGVATLWRGLTSPQGLFAFKYGLVSIALWTPQVVPSSAYFVYSNRGLWALIMAQTGLGVFPGEQIASFLVRIAGTVIGLVIGLIVWYIGAPGNGSGNPYGITAATLVFVGPILFMRILAPIQSMAFWLMTGVTILFVVGYSWVDEHVYQLANQGSGAALAGRRALLVIVGFTAAFIVMLIPRPMTARQVARRNIAKNIAATSDLYARIVGGVEEEAEPVEDGSKQEGTFDVSARVDKIRGPFLKILGRMQSVQMQMAFASAEPGLRGPWPKEKYGKLVNAHSNMLGALILLASAYARLEPAYCRRLERADHLHPAFVADCLALFTLLHQSLLTGQPLPPTMPIFERLAYHSMRRGDLAHRQSHHERHESDGDSDIETSVETQEDGRALALLDAPLTWDTCHQEQLTIFATAVVALTHIANGLNEMQKVIVDLVGVREAGHFDKAQERWGRYETSV